MKTGSSHVRFAAAGLAGLFILLLGCSQGKKSPAAAVVDKEEISLQEMEEILSKERRSFATAEEELSEKQRLLDSLIEERLLLREAYRRGLDRDSSVLGFREREGRLYLIELLYSREVRDKTRLPVSELRRFHRELKRDRCLKQIQAPTKLFADTLLALVRRGASFDSLARVFSRDPAVAGRDGDIGCYGWNRPPPPELFEKILALKPGELAGPFPRGENWILLQCYDARPAEVPDFELIEPELRMLLEPGREGERSDAFVVEVRRELDFQIVDSTARFVNRMQQELSKIDSPGKPVRYSIQLRTDRLTPAERNMPLATYRGGVLTAGEYLESLQGSAPLQRPLLDTTERTRLGLAPLVIRDLMARAAASRGLDQDPELEKLVKRGMEEKMLRVLIDRIVAGVRIDSARVRKHYQARPEEFTRPPAAHLFEIVRKNKAEIESLKVRVTTKSELMAFATLWTLRVQIRSSGGDLGWVEERQSAELFGAASRMKPGEIAGPVQLADGNFSLIYLEARRPARKWSFSEVKRGLSEQLLNRTRDSVFSAWLDAEKKKAKIVVYPEVLRASVNFERYARLKEWREKKQKEGVS